MIYQSTFTLKTSCPFLLSYLSKQNDFSFLLCYYTLKIQEVKISAKLLSIFVFESQFEFCHAFIHNHIYFPFCAPCSTVCDFSDFLNSKLKKIRTSSFPTIRLLYDSLLESPCKVNSDLSLIFELITGLILSKLCNQVRSLSLFRWRTLTLLNI